MVSISIIALLMSLILPAVQKSRMAARSIECRNNLRNLGVAMSGFLTAHDRFPAAGNWAGIPGSRFPGHNWVVDLLPYLDRADIYDRWDKDVAFTDVANADLARLHLEVLACPEDITVNGAGDLSYGVAAGIGYTTFHGGVHDCPVSPFGSLIDLNGNGVVCVANDQLDGGFSDRKILKQLGLFFMENWGPYPGVTRHHTPASVTDGFSNTLMIIENIRTGYDPTRPEGSWASPLEKSASVYYSTEVCPSNTCTSGNVNYANSNAGTFRINAGVLMPEGEAPFASSFHVGGVHALFADGHVDFMSEDIDGVVYAALYSPGGSRLDQTSMRQP